MGKEKGEKGKRRTKNRTTTYDGEDARLVTGSTVELLRVVDLARSLRGVHLELNVGGDGLDGGVDGDEVVAGARARCNILAGGDRAVVGDAVDEDVEEGLGVV